MEYENLILGSGSNTKDGEGLRDSMVKIQSNFNIVKIIVPSGGTTGQSLVKNSDDNYDTKWEITSNGSSESYDTIGFIVDNGLNNITNGSKGYRKIDNDFIITGWTILASDYGDCEIDIRKVDYNDYPNFTGITNSNYPTLVSEIKKYDNDLLGWLTSFSSGDILEFYINSSNNINKLSFFLKIKNI